MAQFRSPLSDESYQYYITTATYSFILLHFFLTKKMIAPFLTTMWDHMDGCTKQYHCASAIYIISCLALVFYIVIEISVGSPVHGKDVIDCLNPRDKRMLNLEMEKILNPE